MLPLRILAIAILFASLIIDTTDFKDIIKSDVQIILGIGIVAIIMFVDSVTGLILGLTVLIMYLRVYAKIYGIKIENIVDVKKLLLNEENTAILNYPMETLVTDNYITEKNLEDAQNNIVDKNVYNKEYIGIKGVYGEPVLGAEGINKELPGYQNDAYISSPADFPSA